MAQAAKPIYQITIEDVMKELLLRRLHGIYLEHSELCVFFFAHKRNICMNQANCRLNRVVDIILTEENNTAYLTQPQLREESDFIQRISDIATKMNTWKQAVQIFYTGLRLASFYMSAKNPNAVTTVPVKISRIRTSPWFATHNGWNTSLNKLVDQNEVVDVMSIHQLIRHPTFPNWTLNTRRCAEELQHLITKEAQMEEEFSREKERLLVQLHMIQEQLNTQKQENEQRQRQFDDCKKRRDEVTKSVNVLQGEIDVQDEQYTTMKEQLTACETDKKRLTKEIKKADADCSCLDQKIKELTTEISKQRDLRDQSMRIYWLLKFCQEFEKSLKSKLRISDNDHTLGLSELIDLAVKEKIIPDDKVPAAKKFAKFRNHLVHTNLGEMEDAFAKAWTLCRSIADIPAFSMLSQQIPS